MERRRLTAPIVTHTGLGEPIGQAVPSIPYGEIDLERHDLVRAHRNFSAPESLTAGLGRASCNSASTQVLRPCLGALGPHANGHVYSDARWKTLGTGRKTTILYRHLGAMPRPVFARIRGQSSAFSARSIWHVSTSP